MFSLCILMAAATAAITPVTIIENLENTSECYTDTARFIVSMPQLDDDVIYTVALEQQQPSGIAIDSLPTPDYLISWRIDGHDNSAGFTANFAGNHFRFNGERLQEYHADADMEPFLTHGRVPGVQRTAQFINLLPSMIAREIREALSNPNCVNTFHPDTTVGGLHVAVLHSVIYLNGSIAKETEYTFGLPSLMPAKIQIENNPGSISEQTVTVNYSTPGGRETNACPPITETRLIAAYPDVFERMRQSTFRIDNLPGSPLPAFTLPTTTAERYSRSSGDPFRAPTIVAILDADAAFTPRMIEMVRRAVDTLPFSADVIWAFTGRHTDTIEQATGPARPGEHILMGAGSLARDCGVTTPPALILTDTGGNVTDVIVGFNNDVESDVIQKMALENR